MKKVFSLLLVLVLGCSFGWADESKSKELERVDAAAKVLNQIQSVPDKGIPQEIMAGAQCVIVVPSMVKAAFIFGGNYGKGVATCRIDKGNHWSAPAPIRIAGGSWGLQIGGQAVDLVLLAMNDEGVQHLLSSKFKVGVDASATAGPVGRHASADTDWKMRAQLLTYSRSRGVFGGISLTGAAVNQDKDDTRALYGKEIGFKRILSGEVPRPAGTRTFLAAVHKYFDEARAKKAEEAKAGESGNATGASGGTTGATNQAKQSSGNNAQGATGSVASPQQGQNESNATTTEMTPAAVSSGGVRGNIMQALHNTPNLATGDVDVDVNDKVVVLTGSVPSQNDRATVLRIAQQNAGGRQVVDTDLMIK